VHSDGAIWFGDPGYGIMPNREGHKALFELPANVYRFDPKTREVTVVASDMDKPHGLCFFPDEKRLYIVDTLAPRHAGDLHPIRVYEVVDGRAAEQWPDVCGCVAGLIRWHPLRC
jgi:gluconolactonase